MGFYNILELRAMVAQEFREAQLLARPTDYIGLSIRSTGSENRNHHVEYVSRRKKALDWQKSYNKIPANRERQNELRRQRRKLAGSLHRS